MIRLIVSGMAAHARSGRVLFLLTLLGVALGVASVLSIQILNSSALGAFEGSLRAVGGEADLTILPQGPWLDEALYPVALATEGVAAAWPVFRIDVALAGPPELFLDVVGVDLLSTGDLPWSEMPADFGPALGATPGWVAVMPSLAERLGWREGDTVEVSSGSRRARLTVGALVDFRTIAPLAPERIVVMDIAQAQSLFGRRGSISQIDVVAAEGVEPAALAARLDARLGAGVQARTPAQRRDDARGLLAAFRLNLTALSLISLFVGAFLVYCSTQASLVRRRAEFGLLRSLGASPAQVIAMVLADVAVVGVLGVALGIPLGYAAARANLAAVSGTLSSLYLLEELEQLTVPWWLLAATGGVGVGSALLGALLPALELARRETRDLLAAFTLHERVDAAAARLFAAGVAGLAAALAWYATLGRAVRPAGFVVGIALLVALPLMSPWLVRRAAAGLTVRSFGMPYGLRTLALRLGVTSVTAAALAVAVSMLVGITLMISGFRRTLEVWVDTTVRADVYVTTPSFARARGEAAMDDTVIRALSAHPRVRAVDRLRQLFAEVGGARVPVIGVPMALAGGESRFVLMEGDAGGVLRDAAARGSVLIGEPLARRLGIGAGDRLDIAGAAGGGFEVAGVYYDYGSERGSVAMDLSTMTARFGEGPINNVALYLDERADAAAVVDDLKRLTSGTPLLIRSNRELRAQVMRIFDQTFAVTRLLQIMSLLIAVSGVTLALLVLARERIPELALYRALGARRSQIFRVFLGKGLGLAAFGLALGGAGGAGLALVLVYLINRAYFGWTIRMHWPLRDLAFEAALLLAAAAAASLYPAWRASRTPATELSRDDL